jgi:outer membrane lipoprotein-sorting protein
MSPFYDVIPCRNKARSKFLCAITVALVATGISVRAQEAQLKTADAVLERFKEALGGVQAIQKVQSMTVRGEAESSARPGKSTFVYYARPFKSLFKLTRPDGTEITAGFDGKASWTVTPQGASIDKNTPVDAIRRDADLQYALHQPDYFRKLELAGVTEFEGHRCYWLHGTTNWGKDNNQFYDIDTGLLIGYRFESDDASKTITIALFQEYKNFGGPLMATKHVTRAGDRSQTITYESVNYESLADSLFEPPEAVKRLMK